MGKKLFNQGDIVEGSISGFGKQKDPLIIDNGRSIFIKDCKKNLNERDKVRVKIIEVKENFDFAQFIEVVERINK